MSIMADAKTYHFEEIKSVFALSKENQGYQQVSDLFQGISASITPNEKFMKISEFPDAIRRSVDEYHVKFDLPIDTKVIILRLIESFIK